MNLSKIRFNFNKALFLIKWIWSIKGTYSSQILVISAIIVISTSIFITIDSQTPDLFKTTQEDIYDLEISHISVKIPYELDFNSFPLGTIHQTNNNLQNFLVQSDLEVFLESSWMNPNVGIRIWKELNNLSNDYRGGVFFFEEKNKELISNLFLDGSYFPQDSNEIILIIPNSINEHFLMNSSYFFSSDIEFNSSTSLKVTGIIPVSTYNNFTNFKDYNLYLSEIQNITGLPLESTDKINLLCQKMHYPQIVQTIGKTIGRSPSELKITSTIDFYLRIKANLLESSKISSYLSRLSNFEKMIKSEYNQAFVNSRRLTSQLIIFQGKIGNVILIKFLFSGPLLIISLVLIKYSINVTEIERKRMIFTLRVRGLSLIQLLSFVVFEFFIVILLSTIIGVFSGIFISYSILKVINPSIPFLFRLENWIFILVLIGVISTFFAYKTIFGDIIKIFFKKKDIRTEISNQSTVSTLGVKLFFLGVTLFLVLVLIEVNRGAILPLLSIYFFQILTLVLALSSLFLTCIGLISFMNIIFQITISFLSNLLWPTFHKKILVLAMKNLTRFKKSVSRIWYLLVFLIIITISSMTFNESLNNYFYDQAKFNVGADYKIQFLPIYENDIESYVKNSISEHVSITSITIAEFNRKHTSGVGWGSLYSIKVLGIDPDTYFNMNIDHAQYNFHPSIKDFGNTIGNNDTNAAVSLGMLEEENLEIGGIYSLNMVATNQSRLGDYYFHFPIKKFRIFSSYSIYPFVTTTNLGGCSMIVHKKYLEGLDDISDDKSDISLNYYFLIENSPKISKDLIRVLEDNFSAHVVSLNETASSLKKKSSWDQIELTLNTNIIYTILIASSCLILFGKFQITVKTREHAIERVLGLTINEIFLIAVYESIIIISSALILGLIIGTVFSGIFFLTFAPFIFLHTTGFFPNLIIPLFSFIGYSLFLFFFMIISVIPSIFLQQRYDIGILLKRVEFEG